MKLIHTTDGNAYRRWINFVLCFIIPGSAQFLSGRKRAGVFWFLGYLAVTAGVLAYVLHPETALCVVSYEPLQWITFPLLVAMIADGIRRPIKRRPLKEWAVFISLWGCLTLLPAFGMRTYLVQPFKIPTGAMEPTILGNRLDADGNHVDGDRLFVNKLIYRHTEPRRGDVIVFRTKGLTTGKQDTCYIKRLVGLPGETLRIDPPFVVVNGVRL